MIAEPLVCNARRARPRPVAMPTPVGWSPIGGRCLRAHREAEWDRYVRSAAGATFFHQLGWRWLVERTFGHRAHYLTALRDGRIVGVLPLFELKSLLFGHSLVSIPFAIGGGLVADDAAAAKALLAAAKDLARERRVDYLELRSETPLDDPELVTKNLYVTFRADLAQGEEALLKRMDRKRRQMMSYVAEGARSRPRRRPQGAAAFLQDVLRQHAPPRHAGLSEAVPWPTRSSTGIRRIANLFFVYHEGQPVAGVLNLLFRDVVMPFYAGADRTERPRGVDDYLYLAIMRWGRENGFRTFDFGRSKTRDQNYKFKARWGMDEVPLGYQYYLVKARELPNVSPANPRYQKAIGLWQKLPMPVTRLLGPSIVKRVP